MGNILEIKNFSKIYSDGKKAVDDLSISVAAGEIHGFIGHNGAGKTTTIRAVVGVMDFDDGEIFIDGHSVRKEPQKCKQITAYIPDNPDLYDYITGIQYLNFMADIFSVDSRSRSSQVHELAGLLELTDSLGNLISSYSHGMKQKLALIGAFLHNPRLLVLDEPFVGLDPQATYHLKNLMHDLCGRGSAIFFSTHVLDAAEKLCDNVSIIKSGKLIVSGSMNKIRGSHSLEEVFMEVTENEK